MILGTFILFCKNGRVEAAHLAAEIDTLTSLVYEGRIFRRIGVFGMHHHLITDQKQLTGFVLEDACGHEATVSNSRLCKATNCTWDGYALTVFLAANASDLDNDGATVMLGPTIYKDDASEIMLAVENRKGCKSSPYWSDLYDELAFGLETKEMPVPEAPVEKS